MEKLNNRYVKIGAICGLTFVFTRIIIALANTYLTEQTIPFPNILALIAAVVIGWLAAKSIRY